MNSLLNINSLNLNESITNSVSIPNAFNKTAHSNNMKNSFVDKVRGINQNNQKQKHSFMRKGSGISRNNIRDKKCKQYE